MIEIKFHNTDNRLSTCLSCVFCCPQALLMWTCDLPRSSSKSSSGSGTSTAAWTPSSIPATAVSSSWPSFGSSGASVTSRNVLAGGPTTTAPPPSAPLETHAKAPPITPPAGWTEASAPCRPPPVPAPATWARASLRVPRGRRCTSGGPQPRLSPLPTCCPAARPTASRELWEGRSGTGKHPRRQLEAFSPFLLGTLRTKEDSLRTSSTLKTKSDSVPICHSQHGCRIYISLLHRPPSSVEFISVKWRQPSFLLLSLVYVSPNLCTWLTEESNNMLKTADQNH